MRWLVFILVLLSAAPAGAQPRLVIAPPGPAAWRALFAHPEQWPQSRARTGTFLFADHTLTEVADDELRGWFAQARAWHIRIELEVGAIKEWGPTADATFAAEQPIWDRLMRLGADIGSIAMDEPLTASRAFLHKPDAYAVEQTARFIAKVHHADPGFAIGDIEPYPSISRADHAAWLTHLDQALSDAGEKPLDFYRLDVDWIAFTQARLGSWVEVAGIEANVHTHHLPFSLIYWASGYPFAKVHGLATEATWYDELIQQGSDAAGASVQPDEFVLESWLDTPSKEVPERFTETFTGSALDFAEKFISKQRKR
jgi:hypothetical protein